MGAYGADSSEAAIRQEVLDSRQDLDKWSMEAGGFLFRIDPEIPFIKLGQTSSQLDNMSLAVLRATVQNKLREPGIDMKNPEDLYLAYIRNNGPGGCNARAPYHSGKLDPDFNVSLLLMAAGCTTPKVGRYTFREVLAAQTILPSYGFAPEDPNCAPNFFKEGYVNDDEDVMAYKSVTDVKNWPWWEKKPRSYFQNPDPNCKDDLAEQKFILWQLAKDVIGDGAITTSRQADPSGLYPGGEIILTANPASAFKQWLGACALNKGNVCNLLLDRSQATTAVFEKQQPDVKKVVLKIGRQGKGKVIVLPDKKYCPPKCTYEEPKSQKQKQLIPKSEKGWKFDKWLRCARVVVQKCVYIASKSANPTAVFSRK